MDEGRNEGTTARSKRNKTERRGKMEKRLKCDIL
jgi:hypothetical protein